MSLIRPYLTWLAELLQALFVLSVPLLAIWRVSQRERSKAWDRLLLFCVWLAIVGAGLGLLSWLANTLVAHLHHGRSFWFWYKPVFLLLPMVALLFKPLRHSWWWAWAMAIVLADPFGLFERSVIIMTSLHRDYLPSSWTLLHPWYYFILPGSFLLSPMIMLWAQRRTRKARAHPV